MKILPEIALVLSIALTCAIETMGFRIGFFMLDPAIADLPFFLLGMVLIKYKNVDLKRMMLIAGGLLALWVALRFITHHPTVVYFNRFLIRPAIIISLIWGSRYVFEKLKDSSLLAFMLKNSFAIYLFHMTFIYLARHFFETQIPVWAMLPIEFAMAVVGSVFCATAMRKIRASILIGEK